VDIEKIKSALKISEGDVESADYIRKNLPNESNQ